jgi:hypothetical protein
MEEARGSNPLSSTTRGAPAAQTPAQTSLLSAHVRRDNKTEMREIPMVQPEATNRLAGKPKDRSSWDGDLQVIELSESEIAEVLVAVKRADEHATKRRRAIELIRRTSSVED